MRLIKFIDIFLLLFSSSNETKEKREYEHFMFSIREKDRMNQCWFCFPSSDLMDLRL